MGTENLFENLAGEFPEEFVSVLVQKSNVRIERIVSTGHSSPNGYWYDQDEHEWVVVLKGKAKLLFENDKTINMGPGDYMLIPARRKHRVEWTSVDESTVWLAVFYRE